MSVAFESEVTTIEAFEQFLLVAAAIKPADLPATREEARTF